MKNDASIGIIGSADGPTAIFVTSTSISDLIWTIIGAAAVICAVTVLLVRRMKRRKK